MYKPPLSGSNTSRVKAHNVQAILLNLLHNRVTSRVQLAEQTGLSKTTITNLVTELMEQGIVTEEAVTDAPENGRRQVGRPQKIVHLVPNARYVIGVHIGIGLFRVAITNLHAEIVHNNTVLFDLNQPWEEVLMQIAAQIETTLQESGIDPVLVLGAGIGVSGLIDYRTGINHLAPSLGWHDVPVKAFLEKRLNLPVCADNNVRAMSLGEAYFGLGKGVGIQAFIYGRIGVGAGFVINGQLFRGFGAGAGEIGHTIVLPHEGAACRCGQHGCLETLVSEPVLLREAQALAAAQPDGVLAAYLNQAGNHPIDAVFAAARAGDQSTLQLIDDKAYYLGIALANLVNILNPELIILGGMFAQASDLIIPKVDATMKQLTFAHMGDRVRLQPTHFGWRAGVVGAASLALMGLFYAADEPFAP
ncbi:MAG: ROK family transcriptional regulator [Candidatus Promineifilaceae bacterium]